MPNFETSRTLNRPAVNGKQAPRRGERISLKPTAKPATARVKAQPVSVAYTKRTTNSIVNEQFANADAHTKEIETKKEWAYYFIHALELVFVIAMCRSGYAFASTWQPPSGVAVPDGVRFASQVLFSAGPIMAYALSYFLKIGVFSGPSKKIAWAIIIGIVVEEAMALRATRDIEFGNWLMIEVGPYSLAATLIALIAMAYLRSDLKRNRDLAEMKAGEEDMIAKNATDARMMKERAERRSRSLAKMGGLFSHLGAVFIGFFSSMIFGFLRGAYYSLIGAWDAALPDIATVEPKKKPKAKRKVAAKK